MAAGRAWVKTRVKTGVFRGRAWAACKSRRGSSAPRRRPSRVDPADVPMNKLDCVGAARGGVVKPGQRGLPVLGDAGLKIQSRRGSRVQIPPPPLKKSPASLKIGSVGHWRPAGRRGARRKKKFAEFSGKNTAGPARGHGRCRYTAGRHRYGGITPYFKNPPRVTDAIVCFSRHGCWPDGRNTGPRTVAETHAFNQAAYGLRPVVRVSVAGDEGFHKKTRACTSGP